MECEGKRTYRPERGEEAQDERIAIRPSVDCSLTPRQHTEEENMGLRKVKTRLTVGEVSKCEGRTVLELRGRRCWEGHNDSKAESAIHIPLNLVPNHYN